MTLQNQPDEDPDLEDELKGQSGTVMERSTAIRSAAQDERKRWFGHCIRFRPWTLGLYSPA